MKENDGPGDGGALASPRFLLSRGGGLVRQVGILLSFKGVGDPFPHHGQGLGFTAAVQGPAQQTPWSP